MSSLVSSNQPSDSQAAESVLRVGSVFVVLVRVVIGSVSLVSVDTHGSISVDVRYSGSVGAVDGNLVEVGSQSVSMSISVSE